MAFCLSFTDEFFHGDGSVDIHDIAPASRPSSVLQAIISLPHDLQVEIAREVLGYGPDTAQSAAECESFPFDVLDRVRETDTCSNLDTPVRVWIDPEGHYTVDVY